MKRAALRDPNRHPVASRAENTPAPGLPRDEVDPPPRAPHRRDAARKAVGEVLAAGRVRPQRRTRIVMPRPLLAAPLVAALLAVTPPAPASAPGALDRARALIARGDGRSAATVLETALPSTPAAQRPQLLQDLRRAYELAIQQAEAAGQTRVADAYRENLQILSRKLPAPTLAAPASSTPPAPPAPLASESGPQDAPPPPTTARIEPPAAESTPKTDFPHLLDDEPPAPGPIADPLPALAPTPPPSQPDRLVQADAAFRAGRYDEAGQHYSALARERKLPEARRDHWAYCLRVEVVRRINARPATAAEWASIRAEVQRIQQISTRAHWHNEYLRNLVAERSARVARTATGGLVVRGSAPDEDAPGYRSPAPAPIPAPAPTPLPAPAPSAVPAPIDPALHPTSGPAPAPTSASAPVGQPGAPVGQWQVRMTPNFRILHSAADTELATRVAEVAETTRAEQARRWAGTPPTTPWTPKCDIYLYPSATVYSQVTGQPEDSPGFSTMGLKAGQIIARRVNLHTDHPNLVRAVLPHEVTHIVLADLFTTQQIPRWADEGMAVLTEPTDEQARRDADLAEPLRTQRLFRAQDLLTMDYPDGQYWSLYYAQSVSLTRFLVEQQTPAYFIKFLQAAQQGSYETALRQFYQIDSYADLHARWLAHARSTSATATATVEATAAREGETQRR